MKPVTAAPTLPVGSRVVLATRTVKLSPGLWLLLLGLNGYFILPFLFSTDISSPAILWTQRYYYLTYVFLVLGGLLEGRRLQNGLQRYRGYMTWAWVFLAAIVWMMIRSVAAGEPIVVVLWNAVTYFSVIAIGLAGQSTRNWSILNKVFIAQTLIGGVYVVWLLLSSGVQSRSDIVSLSFFTLLVSGGDVIPAPLYAGPILMYSYAIQPRLGKLAAIFGYLMSLLIYLFFQNRSGIGGSIGQILILVIIMWRSRQIGGIKFRTMVFGLVVIVLVLFFIYNSPILDSGLRYRFSQAEVLSFRRLTLQGGILDTVAADARWEEARIVFENLTWDEWLVGRGVAATWSDYRLYMGELRTMVHVGYAHYIFQGGILLLLLMLVPLVWGVRALLKSRDLFTLAASGYVIQYYATIVVYGFPSASLAWMLLCLAIGRCAVSVMQPSEVMQRDSLISILKR